MLRASLACVVAGRLAGGAVRVASPRDGSRAAGGGCVGDDLVDDPVVRGFASAMEEG